MNKLIGFTDDELYILKRALIESSFKFFCGEKYVEGEQDIHTRLSNEIIDEISLRKQSRN